MSNENKNTVPTNFIRNIIEKNLEANLYVEKKWSGQPGPSYAHKDAAIDTAKIRTRFPPEPNGYLHFGHAKSIILNFTLAQDFNGRCHLRFDDTNPEKENEEYVKSIIDSVHWLGYKFEDEHENNLYYASNYFDYMYEAAKVLINAGLAYVDKQTAEEIRINRGTLIEPGQDSPFRDQSVEENLKLFEEMKSGQYQDGEMVLRAKINMASPNINLRDPAIYRIRHVTHHNTGDKWCIYPMYTFAHPIEDALEKITHSICTLEFEDQRPFYEWVLKKLAEFDFLEKPLPKQHEFSRLNLSHVVLSKRKLIQLVEEKHVNGWDDPRMPTLVGAKRRGYHPKGFKLFMDRIGVSKSDSVIDYQTFEDSMREVLNEECNRKIAVLNPIKLIIENFDENHTEICTVPNHPQKPEEGTREVKLTKELWIENEDFEINPPPKYFRLFPGNKVRLRYGFVIECTDYKLDDDGNVSTVFCKYFPETKSGTAGSDAVKVKGNIHWLSTKFSKPITIRNYDRLFLSENPNEFDNFLDDINQSSIETNSAYCEESISTVNTGEQFQFERHGYYIVDPESNSDEIIFNRTATLRDNWQK
jgi:glutaminyl-tRNA synthetase